MVVVTERVEPMCHETSISMKHPGTDQLAIGKCLCFISSRDCGWEERAVSDLERSSRLRDQLMAKGPASRLRLRKTQFPSKARIININASR